MGKNQLRGMGILEVHLFLGSGQLCRVKGIWREGVDESILVASVKICFLASQLQIFPFTL